MSHPSSSASSGSHPLSRATSDSRPPSRVSLGSRPPSRATPPASAFDDAMDLDGPGVGDDRISVVPSSPPAAVSSSDEQVQLVAESHALSRRARESRLLGHDSSPQLQVGLRVPVAVTDRLRQLVPQLSAGSTQTGDERDAFARLLTYADDASARAHDTFEQLAQLNHDLLAAQREFDPQLAARDAREQQSAILTENEVRIARERLRHTKVSEKQLKSNLAVTHRMLRALGVAAVAEQNIERTENERIKELLEPQRVEEEEKAEDDTFRSLCSSHASETPSLAEASEEERELQEKLTCVKDESDLETALIREELDGAPDRVSAEGGETHEIESCARELFGHHVPGVTSHPRTADSTCSHWNETAFTPFFEKYINGLLTMLPDELFQEPLYLFQQQRAEQQRESEAAEAQRASQKAREEQEERFRQQQEKEFRRHQRQTAERDQMMRVRQEQQQARPYATHASHTTIASHGPAFHSAGRQFSTTRSHRPNGGITTAATARPASRSGARGTPVAPAGGRGPDILGDMKRRESDDSDEQAESSLNACDST